MQIRVAIHGAAGRMGQRLIACASIDPELQVVAALESADCPRLGEDSGIVAGVGANQVPLTTEFHDRCDVVIDFSTPAGAEAALKWCVARKLPLVLATTGFSPEFQTQIETAAHEIPVLTAPNMSTSVNLAIHLAQKAAEALHHLGSDADVEII